MKFKKILIKSYKKPDNFITLLKNSNEIDFEMVNNCNNIVIKPDKDIYLIQ